MKPLGDVKKMFINGDITFWQWGLYSYVYLESDRSGVLVSSSTELAQLTEMSADRVRRAIARLCQLGAMQSQQHGRRRAEYRVKKGPVEPLSVTKIGDEGVTSAQLRKAFDEALRGE